MWDLFLFILICKPTALASHLKKHCYTLAQPPLARWPQADPHFQIITNLMWPTKEGAELQGGVRFTWDNLLLKDGGIVALDWAVSLTDQQAQAKRDHHPGGRFLCHRSSNPAIVVIIPNTLGRVTPHLLRLCYQTLQQGFYPVVFHRRGHGGCPLTTHYQKFGNASDLVQAVAYLRSHHPTSTLLAVSEGSGSGLLPSYLGECGSSSYLTHTYAACISPVFHGQLWFEYELPWLYHWIARMYRNRITECQTRWPMLERTVPRLSMKPDWPTYWERNEPLRDANEVAVPVLCLCSQDDPLLPPLSTVPEALFHNSPYFLLAVTEQGGHCGFMQDGHGGTTSWSHSVVLEYFRMNEGLTGLERHEG
uniref:Abhydrolase domain containing 15 n=1 Tax=Sinocyclocheilus rhinocerous TaxID=307959 RepID=A0A673GRB7_9TELE